MQSLEEIETSFLLLGIGVGAPNGNYYEGTIENAPNLAWKGKIEFVKLFFQLHGNIMIPVGANLNFYR